MGKDHIKELSAKHLICDYERIRKEYLGFKARNIDTLEYVNDSMLAAYEYAFFSNLTKTKLSRKDLPKEISPKIFKAALEEVKKRYVPGKGAEDKGLVCNLYSIVNPPSF
ncbi:hypothetical protein [Encephalitozoon cuniculi GB-M1]|uniref:Uncharacterized protein n=2 Tax=Encephalitozoon cuniculi TaxID=6035 RepID=Q8SWC7_ENCCU|nr:uncharacterized protein ECU02_0910 [Encephalitozoon cuniculi GB-M1]AGE95635.1 hypothetical protein ECU02_0910 [Encephalitozoon cuniculi]KMV66609.1 hypothetical protein M970_020860 [Encephalitozoon cuniculi EcunIII-L]UYI28284.1 putative origin recognition complex subunit [Encephalitozoon cuniculi]CAD25120.1 hypothetical protein [Encephalitozoon cuniculi GB-M1]